MRKIYLLTAFMLFVATSLMAQLSGSKTIPGDYANVAAAVTDLNVQGVGAGGVTFNVAAGHTETSDIPEITTTGTVANPIIFQKSGAGANPLLTRLTAGTVASTTTLGSNGDGIIIINGGDYITFDGIDLQTDATFTTAGMMEYGYYLKKASATDACKNVTIRNSVITLNKAAIYSFGIFVSNISGTATVTVTSTGGRSENINLSGNTITNTYGGIQLRGYAAATPFDFYDQNINVGVDSGNIISNYGGGTTTTYGIYCIYQNNLVIANNNINNTANGGTASANTFYGMFLSTGTNSNVEIHHNTISITAGGTTQTAYALNNAMGASGTNNLVSIHDNTITSCSYPAATSGVLYLLYQNTSPFTSHIYNNTVTGNSLTGTSGSLYCLYQSGAVVNEGKIYGNTITGNTKTSTGTMYCLYNSPASTSTNDVYSNIISGNSGSGTLNGIYQNAGLVTNIFKNQVFNQSSSGATGIVYGMTVAAGPLTTNIFNNFISDLKSPAGDAAADGVRGINITSTTANSSINVDYNTIYLNATSSGVNFSTSGVYHTYSATATSGSLTMRNNILVNMSTPNGTGIVTAFRRSAATSLVNFNEATNNNDYYAGTPAANRLIYYDGTNSDQTLAAYQARVTPRDINSISELPPFTNVSTPPYDLHISGSSGVSNAGTPVAGITTDIDNDTRNTTTPDIGADEFASASGIDLRATNLVNPTVKNCYSTTETVTIQIQNNSSVTHDFSVNPVTVTTNVTGTVTQTLTAVVNSGTLGAGLTLDVPMLTTLNMTTTGVYTFNAYTTVSGDINTGNDSMPPVNRTKVLLAAGTVSASPTQYCITGGTPTLTVTGATGGDLQWQQSITAGSGFTDIPGATTSPYTVGTPITQTMYYRLNVSCDGNMLTSNEVTVTLNNPQITSTTPGASCGPGPVTVTLAATGNSAVLNWYDVATGGVPIGTGSPFITPPISVNTDYWVSASDGGTSGNVGPVNNSIGAGAGSTILIGTQQMFFDVLAPSITINTVTIYPTASIGSSFTIVIQNSSTAQVYSSGPMTTTVTGGTTPQVVTLNAVLLAGTGYRFGFSTNPGMWRNSLGAVYPYTLPGVVSITGNSFDPDYYYWFYNWSVSSGCEGPRTMVTATVTTPPSATISYAGSPYCSNAGTATVTQTGTAGGTYSSTAGLSINPATGEITLGTSTPGTYTVTYSIAPAGGCPLYTTTASVTITAAPAATIAYTGSPYCSSGGTATVTHTGTAGGTYSSTAGLTINAATGEVTLGTSTPGTYTVTYSIAAGGGCALFTTTGSITINAAPGATISYAGSPYCTTGGIAAVTQTGTTGGAYSSTAGLTINAATGEVTLATST
ncbi:MAG: hypothetical protein WAR78_02300, partial [Ferruginibacter sp.]